MIKVLIRDLYFVYEQLILLINDDIWLYYSNKGKNFLFTELFVELKVNWGVVILIVLLLFFLNLVI